MFFTEFHQLWSYGFTAHLDLNTQAGNACEGLRVQLGQVPGPPQLVQPFPQQVHRNCESPTHQWRRAKRVAAKAANGNDSDAEEAVEARSTEKEKEPTNLVAEKVQDGKVAESAKISKPDLKDISDEICPDEISLDVKNQKSNPRGCAA